GIVFEKAAAVVNIVIASCMTSACGELFGILRVTENIEIFSVISLILAIIICLFGVGGLQKFSAAAMPVSLALLLVVLIAEINLQSFDGFGLVLISDEKSSALSPLLYVGMNIFVSSPLLAAVYGEADGKTGAAISAVTALVLAALIGFFAYLIDAFGLENSDMPTLYFLKDNPAFTAVAKVVCFSGVFSTLVCSLYSSFSLFSGKGSIMGKIIIVLVVLRLSCFGFSGIVESFYPVIGGAGVVYALLILLKVVFPKWRRARTLPPKEDIKSQCLPLRGRV
ncbi:MAG: hypothetical protein IJS67_03715, partial [Clostridia bacterium]|nr:hypothetical protein [Clostridia bacterium]